jgi:hypothetical protein
MMKAQINPSNLKKQYVRRPQYGVEKCLYLPEISQALIIMSIIGAYIGACNCIQILILLYIETLSMSSESVK